MSGNSSELYMVGLIRVIWLVFYDIYAVKDLIRAILTETLLSFYNEKKQEHSFCNCSRGRTHVTDSRDSAFFSKQPKKVACTYTSETTLR